MRLAAAPCACVLLLIALGGCGSRTPVRATRANDAIPATLVAQARPIGRGPRFHPPARGPVLGSCRSRLGPRDAVHLELFGADRVVLIAAGIGTRPPRHLREGRISGAGCYGSLVTLEPTGLVLVRRGARLTVADLFRSWDQRLTGHRIAGFTGPLVTAYVDGRRWSGSAGRIVLRRHAEIVLEIGPHVPPHSTYRFPPGL